MRARVWRITGEGRSKVSWRSLDRSKVSWRSLDRSKVSWRSLDRSKVSWRSLDRSKVSWRSLAPALLVWLAMSGPTHAQQPPAPAPQQGGPASKGEAATAGSLRGTEVEN